MYSTVVFIRLYHESWAFESLYHSLFIWHLTQEWQYHYPNGDSPFHTDFTPILWITRTKSLGHSAQGWNDSMLSAWNQGWMLGWFEPMQARSNSIAGASGDDTCPRAILPIFFDLKKLPALPQRCRRGCCGLWQWDFNTSQTLYPSWRLRSYHTILTL